MKRPHYACQIALCMIVKDEEENLERCLNSVRGLVSEINIVDTGSVDDTVRIAESLGARVRREQWTNDFSRPRNISIQMARTDWILILDADEVLSPDAPEVIRAAIEHAACQGYLLPTRNYTNNSEVANFIPNDGTFDLALDCKGWVESRKIRLFRNLPGIRFEGELHEVVGPSIRRMGGRTEYLNAIVHHFGYLVSQDSLKQKTEKMLSIAEAKCANQGENYKAHYELGVILANLGNPERAEESFRRSIGLRSDFALAHYDLGVVLSRLGREKEALAEYETALKFEPDHINTLNNRADTLQRLRRFDEAERAYRLLLDKHPSAKTAWNNLGALLASTGRPKEARLAFKKALCIDPQNRTARDNLRALSTKSFTPPSLGLLMIVRDEEKDLTEMLPELAPCFDELIIVDTGSNDNTVQIAKKYTDKIFTFPWVDDFSAARNLALSKAESDWILWLDADDRLKPQDVAAMREHISSKKEGFYIKVISETGESGPAEFLQIRLFPNIDGIVWEGRVHEQVIPSLERMGLTCKTIPGIEILHQGYEDPVLREEKTLRNLEILEKERTIRPDDPNVLHHLAQAHFLIGNVKEAIRVTEAFIENRGTRQANDFMLHAMNRLVQYNLSDENITAAEKWANRVIKAQPGNRLVRYFMGEICYRKGSLHEAIDWLEQFCTGDRILGPIAIPWRALKANAHNYLGLSYKRTNRIEEARAEFRKAIEHGARLEARKNLANIYLEEEKLAEAESVLKDAIEANEEDAEILTNLGVTLGRSSRFREAQEILESAVALDPNLTLAHYNLGLVLEKTGELEEAERRYSALLHLDPQNVNALAKLGYLEARKGQWESARPFLERALQLDPTNHYALNNLEYVLGKLRDPTGSHCELSLNMIVKDEEKNIKEILPPIADLFDEIVIVDTGSSDNTVETAEALRARVIYHPWNDNFAEARNVALQNSSGKWIFWLDADDRIEPDAVGVLRKFVARGIPSGVLFPLESVLGNNGSVVQNYSLRLFPNKPGVEWVGIVHEQVANSLRALDIELVNSPDLTIRHVGYEDTGEACKKNLRNMKLLAREIAARPEDPSVLFALAQAFLFWGQKEQGAKWLRLLWELREKADNSHYEDLFWMAAVMLSDCAAACGDAAEADMWLEHAIGLSPNNWLPYFLLGERKFLKGEHKSAARLIGKAAKLGFTPTILPVDLEAMRKRLQHYLQALEPTTVTQSSA